MKTSHPAYAAFVAWKRERHANAIHKARAARAAGRLGRAAWYLHLASLSRLSIHA